MQVLEKQNADLTRTLSDAIGSWTDDKRMTGKLQNVFYAMTET